MQHSANESWILFHARTKWANEIFLSFQTLNLISPFFFCALQSTACVYVHIFCTGYVHKSWKKIQRKWKKSLSLYSISVVLLSHTPKKKLQMCLPSFYFLVSSSPTSPVPFFQAFRISNEWHSASSTMWNFHSTFLHQYPVLRRFVWNVAEGFNCCSLRYFYKVLQQGVADGDVGVGVLFENC